MTERDAFLLAACDEAACREDPVFLEIFTIDDRCSIIRAILESAVKGGFLKRSPQEIGGASDAK